jgi:hypothetical protein
VSDDPALLLGRLEKAAREQAEQAERVKPAPGMHTPPMLTPLECLAEIGKRANDILNDSVLAKYDTNLRPKNDLLLYAHDHQVLQDALNGLKTKIVQAAKTFRDPNIASVLAQHYIQGTHAPRSTHLTTAQKKLKSGFLRDPLSPFPKLVARLRQTFTLPPDIIAQVRVTEAADTTLVNSMVPALVPDTVVHPMLLVAGMWVAALKGHHRLAHRTVQVQTQAYIRLQAMAAAVESYAAVGTKRPQDGRPGLSPSPPESLFECSVRDMTFLRQILAMVSVDRFLFKLVRACMTFVQNVAMVTGPPNQRLRLPTYFSTVVQPLANGNAASNWAARRLCDNMLTAAAALESKRAGSLRGPLDADPDPDPTEEFLRTWQQTVLRLFPSLTVEGASAATAVLATITQVFRYRNLSTPPLLLIARDRDFSLTPTSTSTSAEVTATDKAVNMATADAMLTTEQLQQQADLLRSALKRRKHEASEDAIAAMDAMDSLQTGGTAAIASMVSLPPVCRQLAHDTQLAKKQVEKALKSSSSLDNHIMRAKLTRATVAYSDLLGQAETAATRYAEAKQAGSDVVREAVLHLKPATQELLQALQASVEDLPGDAQEAAAQAVLGLQQAFQEAAKGVSDTAAVSTAATSAAAQVTATDPHLDFLNSSTLPSLFDSRTWAPNAPAALHRLAQVQNQAMALGESWSFTAASFTPGAGAGAGSDADSDTDSDTDSDATKLAAELAAADREDTVDEKRQLRVLQKAAAEKKTLQAAQRKASSLLGQAAKVIRDLQARLDAALREKEGLTKVVRNLQKSLTNSKSIVQKLEEEKVQLAVEVGQARQAFHRAQSEADRLELKFLRLQQSAEHTAAEEAALKRALERAKQDMQAQDQRARAALQKQQEVHERALAAQGRAFERAQEQARQQAQRDMRSLTAKADTALAQQDVVHARTMEKQHRTHMRAKEQHEKDLRAAQEQLAATAYRYELLKIKHANDEREKLKLQVSLQDITEKGEKLTVEVEELQRARTHDEEKLRQKLEALQNLHLEGQARKILENYQDHVTTSSQLLLDQLHTDVRTQTERLRQQEAKPLLDAARHAATARQELLLSDSAGAGTSSSSSSAASLATIEEAMVRSAVEEASLRREVLAAQSQSGLSQFTEQEDKTSASFLKSLAEFDFKYEFGAFTATDVKSKVQELHLQIVGETLRRVQEAHREMEDRLVRQLKELQGQLAGLKQAHDEQREIWEREKAELESRNRELADKLLQTSKAQDKLEAKLAQCLVDMTTEASKAAELLAQKQAALEATITEASTLRIRENQLTKSMADQEQAIKHIMQLGALAEAGTSFETAQGLLSEVAATQDSIDRQVMAAAGGVHSVPQEVLKNREALTRALETVKRASSGTGSGLGSGSEGSRSRSESESGSESESDFESTLISDSLADLQLACDQVAEDNKKLLQRSAQRAVQEGSSETTTLVGALQNAGTDPSQLNITARIQTLRTLADFYRNGNGVLNQLCVAQACALEQHTVSQTEIEQLNETLACAVKAHEDSKEEMRNLQAKFDAQEQALQESQQALQTANEKLNLVGSKMRSLQNLLSAMGGVISDGLGSGSATRGAGAGSGSGSGSGSGAGGFEGGDESSAMQAAPNDLSTALDSIQAALLAASTHQKTEQERLKAELLSLREMLQTMKAAQQRMTIQIQTTRKNVLTEIQELDPNMWQIERYPFTSDDNQLNPSQLLWLRSKDNGDHAAFKQYMEGKDRIDIVDLLSSFPHNASLLSNPVFKEREFEAAGGNLDLLLGKGPILTARLLAVRSDLAQSLNAQLEDESLPSATRRIFFLASEGNRETAGAFAFMKKCKDNGLLMTLNEIGFSSTTQENDTFVTIMGRLLEREAREHLALTPDDAIEVATNVAGENSPLKIASIWITKMVELADKPIPKSPEASASAGSADTSETSDTSDADAWMQGCFVHRMLVALKDKVSKQRPAGSVSRTIQTHKVLRSLLWGAAATKGTKEWLQFMQALEQASEAVFLRFLVACKDYLGVVQKVKVMPLDDFVTWGSSTEMVVPLTSTMLLERINALKKPDPAKPFHETICPAFLAATMFPVLEAPVPPLPTPSQVMKAIHCLNLRDSDPGLAVAFARQNIHQKILEPLPGFEPLPVSILEMRTKIEERESSKMKLMSWTVGQLESFGITDVGRFGLFKPSAKPEPTLVMTSGDETQWDMFPLAEIIFFESKTECLEEDELIARGNSQEEATDLRRKDEAHLSRVLGGANLFSKFKNLLTATGFVTTDPDDNKKLKSIDTNKLYTLGKIAFQRISCREGIEILGSNWSCSKENHPVYTLVTPRKVYTFEEILDRMKPDNTRLPCAILPGARFQIFFPPNGEDCRTFRSLLRNLRDDMKPENCLLVKQKAEQLQKDDKGLLECNEGVLSAKEVGPLTKADGVAGAGAGAGTGAGTGASASQELETAFETFRASDPAKKLLNFAKFATVATKASTFGNKLIHFYKMRDANLSSWSPEKRLVLETTSEQIDRLQSNITNALVKGNGVLTAKQSQDAYAIKKLILNNIASLQGNPAEEEESSFVPDTPDTPDTPEGKTKWAVSLRKTLEPASKSLRADEGVPTALKKSAPKQRPNFLWIEHPDDQQLPLFYDKNWRSFEEASKRQESVRKGGNTRTEVDMARDYNEYWQKFTTKFDSERDEHASESLFDDFKVLRALAHVGYLYVHIVGDSVMKRAYLNYGTKEEDETIQRCLADATKALFVLGAMIFEKVKKDINLARRELPLEKHSSGSPCGCLMYMEMAIKGNTYSAQEVMESLRDSFSGLKKAGADIMDEAREELEAQRKSEGGEKVPGKQKTLITESKTENLNIIAGMLAYIAHLETFKDEIVSIAEKLKLIRDPTSAGGLLNRARVDRGRALTFTRHHGNGFLAYV